MSKLLRFLQKGKYRAFSYRTQYTAAATAYNHTSLHPSSSTVASAHEAAHLHPYAKDGESSSLTSNYDDQFLFDFYKSLANVDFEAATTEATSSSVLEDSLIQQIAAAKPQDYLAALQKVENSAQKDPAAFQQVQLPKWIALVESAVKAGDEIAALKALDLCLKAKELDQELVFKRATQQCIPLGNAKLALDILNMYQSRNDPTLDMHHAVVSCFLQLDDTVAACRHLRSMEDRKITPAQQTYRRVINKVMQTDMSQAWNLFAHMRLVSHPVPDVTLYNVMLKACATAQDASPERAADLFTEMSENRVIPNVETYRCLIIACNRAKRSDSAYSKFPFYYQSLDYLRQLLEAGLRPNKALMHAVLQGCKVSGDLARARWIFFSMLARHGEYQIDEKTMILLFKTYANYKLPVGVHQMKHRQQKNEAASEMVQQPEESVAAFDQGSTSSAEILLEHDADSSITDGEIRLESPKQLPQTKAELVKQLHGIMVSLLSAKEKDYKIVFPNFDSEQTMNAQYELYAEVHLTSALVNAFVMAAGSYASTREGRLLFEKLYDVAGVAKDGTTYKLWMTACMKSKDALAAVQESNKVLQEWKEWTTDRPISDINAESIYTSYIHILARASEIDAAMEETERFYHTFPPSLTAQHCRYLRLQKLHQTPLKLDISSESYPETVTQSWMPPVLNHRNTVMLGKRLADAEDVAALNKLRKMMNAYKRAAVKGKEGSLISAPAKECMRVEAVEAVETVVQEGDMTIVRQTITQVKKRAAPLIASPLPAAKRLKATTSSSPIDELPFDVTAFKNSLPKEHAELLEIECDTIHASWLKLLAPEIRKDYFLNLKRDLAREGYAKILPPPSQIYTWSQTPLSRVKVVILGQDPYHGIGQAHGMSFSVKPGVAIPPSLKNIYKEVKNDYPQFQIPKHGFLQNWAKQGVLLLNACLTVREKAANSHSGKGWEKFTQTVIELIDQYGGSGLSEEDGGVVFLAWGKPALKRVANVDQTKHLVLSSAHPSPLSAHKGYFNNQHFKKANEFLKAKHGAQHQIDWTNLSYEA